MSAPGNKQLHGACKACECGLLVILYGNTTTLLTKDSPMKDILSDHVYYHGPTKFLCKKIQEQDDLFFHRAALLFTPSKNLPAKYIGAGAADISLPIVTPDYLEVREISAYASPKLWVDLIQRATSFIRWTPIDNAKVTITRRDFIKLRDDHYRMGAKALVDSLKYETTGRRDGRSLYYWGGIWDDDKDNASFFYQQEIVDDLSQVGMRIQIIHS